ncbi:MAG: putative heme transporter [Frankiaceae bacterium]|nr:putative heme transporter [Frankiaceae bacterium]
MPPETGVEALLRSRPARWAGLVAGLAALALLTAALVREVQRGHDIRGASPVAFAVSLLGFAAFHAGAIASLRALGGDPAPQVWSAAQLAKYLPAPGAALAGMVHSAVVRGGTARSAVSLTLRHSAVLLAGALLAGAPSVGNVTHDRWGLPVWLVPALMVAVAAGLAVAGTRGIDRRAAAVAVLLATAAWAVLGAALWAGVGHRAGDGLVVATAFAAAWAVGFLALPVPAGIGVREAVLVVLLEPSLGTSGALSFAVLTRVLHVVSDGLVALLFLAGPSMTRAVARRGRSAREEA